MSKQTINIGASPNDGTGTPLRTSFDYTNQNFTELYTALGGGVGLPGATTQVIFNDGGTNLAGDAGLVYNKTTDTLTAGNATITGAATVGTTLGVTGVSTFAAGTALLPALTTTGDTNTGIYYPAADTFAVTTAGVERYRADSTGLGIGGSPVNPLTVFAAASANAPALLLATVGSPTYGWDFSVDGATNGNLFIRRLVASVKTDVMEFDRGNGNVGIGVTPSVKLDILSAAAEGTIRLTSTIDGSNASPKASSLSLRSGSSSVETARIASFNRFSNVGGGDLVFSTADTSAVLQTRATIDSSGNLLLGATLPTAQGRQEITFDGATAQGLNVADSSAAATSTAISFIKSAATCGSIVVTAVATTYNTASDYRLKESVKPISGGLARVNALKPSIYKWKSNGSDGEGFLAHELAEVVPFAVSGEKDAVNADGTIKSQGIDMSRVIPILVAAIQELTARVQTLETR